MITVERAFEVTSEAWKKAEYDARSLSPPLQVVHLIDYLDFEVNLGGVIGWLTNKGAYGPDTAKALDAIEAHQCASIVREILAFFPEGTPAIEDQERVRQMQDLGEVTEDRWSELGDRLLAWPDDIYVLLQKFVEEHADDFS